MDRLVREAIARPGRARRARRRSEPAARGARPGRWQRDHEHRGRGVARHLAARAARRLRRRRPGAHPWWTADPRRRLPGQPAGAHARSRTTFARSFSRWTWCVAPTVPLVAPPIGRTQEPGGPLNRCRRADRQSRDGALQPDGHARDQRAVRLQPGLPVGLQIMAPAFAERAGARRSAAAYEARHAPWRPARAAARLSFCQSSDVLSAAAKAPSPS